MCFDNEIKLVSFVFKYIDISEQGQPLVSPCRQRDKLGGYQYLQELA